MPFFISVRLYRYRSEETSYLVSRFMYLAVACASTACLIRCYDTIQKLVWMQTGPFAKFNSPDGDGVRCGGGDAGWR